MVTNSINCHKPILVTHNKNNGMTFCLAPEPLQLQSTCSRIGVSMLEQLKWLMHYCQFFPSFYNLKIGVASGPSFCCLSLLTVVVTCNGSSVCSLFAVGAVAPAHHHTLSFALPHPCSFPFINRCPLAGPADKHSRK